MYEFMFNTFNGSNAWQYDAKAERKSRERGALFEPEQLQAILALWADAIKGQATHKVDRLTLPTVQGPVHIEPNRIAFANPPSGATMRASMAHIADQWGGRAVIPMSASTSREFRLQARAYAEVFGIQLDDANETFRALALTKAELARLPELRRSIRAAYPEAPPERAGEARELAAANARRNPFRAPAPV